MVTGGASGIGLAISRGLVHAGADLAVSYLESSEAAVALASEARTLGRRVFAHQADLADAEAARTFVVETCRHFDRPIDALVNNAGTMVVRQPLAQLSVQLWQRIIDVNLSSVFYMTSATLPHLRDGGAILNLTSIAAQTGGSVGAGAYAAAKGGVLTLTRGLARELAPRQIRVNALSPGTVATRFHERFSTPEKLAATQQQILLGRIGEPEDCVGAALFLLSEAASFITGEVIEINGGQYFS